ncbi:neuromedin-U isoform X2 [Microcaecilia unicolor]|uniref:Neuromedin-U isoform X2 n=1 Tax=Microcaecilia unicolor TaxID=1415580 RepID=A0A6P7WVP6_9AMPH|nr:neuromedin-U isoform X2 [Microcaecilia unicolor]
MLSSNCCRPAALPSLSATTSSRNTTSLRKLPQGTVLGGLMLLLLFASCMCTCKGAPLSLQRLQGEEDMQLWNEIDNTCSAFLSADPQSQASSALEELCFMVMGILQKSQGLDEKDNAKRFLFHYAKTHDSGNSDIMEELQGPGGIQSRGYFLFRPRNGRRAAGFHQ